MRTTRLPFVPATVVIGALAATVFVTSDAVAQEPNFGRTIEMTATELFIGQPVNWYGPGTVYAYDLNGGEWVERARLSASDAERKDDFGAALAFHGNTLVVGAPRKRDGAGVAYVFTRDAAGSAWSESALIEPPTEGDHSGYAGALAMAGDDDLFIGAPAVDSIGVVYHLQRSGSGWSVAGVLQPSDVPGGAFGQSLHMHDDHLLVGAPSADEEKGGVFVFERQADGAWTEAQVIEAPGGSDGGARFGSSFAADGDRLFIGAPGDQTVYAYGHEEGAGSRLAGSIAPFDGVRGSRFGQSIAVAGGELWVGAPAVNRFNGRVYRFVPGADGEWQSAERVDAEGADGTQWPFAFGFSVAGAGDRVVVGMPYRDFGEGRALAMSKAGDAWSDGQPLEGEIFRIGQSLEPGAKCLDGQIGEFPCASMELVSHMTNEQLGGARGVWVNDVWGWTDPQTGRDYALVARRDGASFVDVTDPSAPRLVGTLPRTVGSPPSVWRDIKVLNDHAYIVSDGAGEHGMQVFDLTRLRDVRGEPVEFAPETTYHEIHSAHNVVADTEAGYLYIVGANGGGETCGGGLHMVDARRPLEPTFAGCYNDTSGSNPRGYTHDAQCVVYDGPDADYQGRQICVGSNEKEINIADVTDKENPVTIGRATYPDAAYTHQGWFDEEQRYFYQNDEIDELQGNIEGTRTVVWDLTELDDPILANQYIGPVMSSDHNLFVVGDRIYEANYGSGLRVLDISDRANPREIAYFDSAPYNDDGPGHSSTQSGAWSNYPFFDSGVVVFTSVREGLFIVRVSDDRPAS